MHHVATGIFFNNLLCSMTQLRTIAVVGLDDNKLIAERQTSPQMLLSRFEKSCRTTPNSKRFVPITAADTGFDHPESKAPRLHHGLERHFGLR